MNVLKLSDIKSSIICSDIEPTKYEFFQFVDHLDLLKCKEKCKHDEVIICKIPLQLLVPKLSLEHLINMGNQHDLFIPCHSTKPKITELFQTYNHYCQHQYVTIFNPYKKVQLSGQSKLAKSLNLVQDITSWIERLCWHLINHNLGYCCKCSSAHCLDCVAVELAKIDGNKEPKAQLSLVCYSKPWINFGGGMN